MIVETVFSSSYLRGLGQQELLPLRQIIYEPGVHKREREQSSSYHSSYAIPKLEEGRLPFEKELIKHTK
jgi:hypothetical protein